MATIIRQAYIDKIEKHLDKETIIVLAESTYAIADVPPTYHQKQGKKTSLHAVFLPCFTY